MITRNADEVTRTPITMKGVEGTTIQWLVSEEDGAPTFALRRFTMAPGGKIPLHGHPWEHEIYFLRGHGKAFTPDGSVDVGPGGVLFIPGYEPHGYENTGDEELVFLCVVPKDAR